MWAPGTSVGTAVRSIAKAARVADSNPVGDEQDKSARLSAGHSPRSRSVSAVKQHELLIGIRPHFLKTREVKAGILRPYKRLLVDVVSSEAKLDDALDAVQTLFTALERKGHHVGFAPADQQMRRMEVVSLDKPSRRYYHRSTWTPDRPTVVHIGDVAIGLTLFEMTEEVEAVYVHGKYLPVRDLSEQQLKRFAGPHHWRTQEEVASGRLCLQAYSPSGLVTWSKRWQENKAGTFDGMVRTIVEELEAVAPVLAHQLQEAKRRAEEERRRREEEWQRYEAKQERLRQEKVRQDSRRELLEAIASWDEVRRVHDFFAAVENAARDLAANDAAAVIERLRLAKDLAGKLDPLERLVQWKAPGER
jgi:hypothetical protein